MHPLLQASIVITAFFANALIIVLFMTRPSRQAKRIFDLTRGQVSLIDEPKGISLSWRVAGPAIPAHAVGTA